ncbi:SpoIIIAH-like family protein [Paenibacillus methanolicus]|uniref:Stage III sporulation protein AH n=1 Tax=Paenibacillus methanolicus TaxID=582686 RepID=A0A5S5CHP6_9BACL|nr:SpoIIIAH-like family protein [Paenibacillus methanolicus]TYP77870.1 stage III sporulation protein AH [Paenibacillus methanolicus]
MNTKRQTVWLVSMLSLMVILSAYYLFTEDVSTSPDLLTEGTKQEQPVDGATEVTAGSGAKNDEVVVNEVTQEGAAEGVLTGDAAKAAADADAKTLQQVEEQGLASNVFDELQLKRSQENAEEESRLMAALGDTKQNTDNALQAMEELSQLEEKNTKVTSLEEELAKTYKSVIITPQAGDKYKVVVQSEKVDRSQADDILVKVVGALNLKAEQVSVQFVQ